MMKHSRNTDVDIRLNEHPSMYQLIIHDYSLRDGRKKQSYDYPGMKDDIESDDGSSDRTKTQKHTKDSDYGMGLESIRTRVESVNGNLTITNDNGYRVFVTVPR